jgi:hypothetical protein
MPPQRYLVAQVLHAKMLHRLFLVKLFAVQPSMVPEKLSPFVVMFPLLKEELERGSCTCPGVKLLLYASLPAPTTRGLMARLIRRWLSFREAVITFAVVKATTTN